MVDIAEKQRYLLVISFETVVGKELVKDRATCKVTLREGTALSEEEIRTQFKARRRKRKEAGPYSPHTTCYY